MRDLRAYKDSIAKARATVAHRSITDLQNVVAAIFERVNRLRLSPLYIGMRLVTVGIQRDRSHPVDVREDLPALVIDYPQPWVELGRLDILSLKLNGQLIAGFDRKLKAIEVA